MKSNFAPKFIESEINRRVELSLRASTTYTEALKYYRGELSLSYKYGTLGRAIDEQAMTKITALALSKDISETDYQDENLRGERLN